MLSALYSYRYFLLLLLLAGCALLWPGVQHALQVDNSLRVWFLEDDPAMQTYQEFQDRFGNDEVVILLVEDDSSVLSARHFDQFIRLSRALEAIPEVAAVLGPGNVQVPVKGMLGAGAGPLLYPQVSVAQVRKQLEENPLLQRQFFAPDEKAVRFLLALRVLPDFDSRRGEILDHITATAARIIPEENTRFGGVGVIFSALNKLSQRDFGLFLGLGYLSMFLLLLFIYRDLMVLLYTLATVALATYLTLGIYGSLGFRLNLMTTLIPTIIVLLGVLDVIHVVNERIRQAGEAKSPKELAMHTLARVFRPCLFTTLTTMAGFLALLSSPMAILRDFGLFAALGILLCLLLTYLLGTILLPYCHPGTSVSGFTLMKLQQLLAFVQRKKALFVACSFLFIGISVLGLFRLKTDTYTLGYFPADHQVVTDHEAMERSWGPYMPLELMITPKAGLHLYAPEVAQAALAFADSAKTLEGVADVFGFATLYEAGLYTQYGEKNRRMFPFKSGWQQAHQQLLTHYPVLARQYIHGQSNTGRITISGAMASASVLRANMDSLMLMASQTLGKYASIQPAGYQPMYASIVNYVTYSQIWSLLLALLLVFLLVWLFLRDLRLALLSLLPNIFPVLLMLGAMGWMSISLDVATASIAAIVLSFCIDDTIHFMHSYRSHRLLGSKPGLAVEKTMRQVGVALVLTSLVLLLGYSLMTLASLRTVVLFGGLTALAILGSLYSHIIIFPLLLTRLDRKHYNL